MAEGYKLDKSKPNLHLIDPKFSEEMATVLMAGDIKHGAANWVEGMSFSRLISAAKRHIHDIEQGIDTDDETKKSSAAHAACSLMFLFYYISNYKKYKKFDDRRWKNGK